MHDAPHFYLGEALEVVYAQALSTYRQKHANHIPYDDLFANHVRTVDLDVRRYRNGALHVSATVHSQRWVPAESEFGRFRLVNGGQYIYERGTFNLQVR